MYKSFIKKKSNCQSALISYKTPIVLNQRFTYSKESWNSYFNSRISLLAFKMIIQFLKFWTYHVICEFFLLFQSDLFLFLIFRCWIGSGQLWPVLQKSTWLDYYSSQPDVPSCLQGDSLNLIQNSKLLLRPHITLCQQLIHGMFWCQHVLCLL